MGLVGVAVIVAVAGCLYVLVCALIRTAADAEERAQEAWARFTGGEWRGGDDA